MNIFVSDPSPQASAWALDDVRLRKMVLETAQLISTSLRARPELAAELPVAPPDVQTAEDPLGLEVLGFLYKATHANHPCAVWARADQRNFDWLVAHFLALGTEYMWRFGKFHASAKKFANYLGAHPLRYSEWDGPLLMLHQPETFADCTLFRDDGPNVPANYRRYLRHKWANDTLAGRSPRWTGRSQPSWFHEGI